MTGIRRVVRARRVEHASDEATRGAKPAIARLAFAAAGPCRGRLGRIARLAGVRRVGGVRRVDHASDEATRAAHPALAHLAVAAAGPVAPGRMRTAARVVAGVARTGVTVVGAVQAGCQGLVNRHAVLADVFGAGVVVVDGYAVDAAAPLSPQLAEINAQVTGSRDERGASQRDQRT